MKKHSVRTQFIELLAIISAYLSVGEAFAQQRSAASSEPLSVILARVPDNARAKRNPFATDPDAEAAGKKLFAQHCAECHGRDAQGARRGPDLRTPEALQATAGEIFWILTNGVVRRGMPPWSKLPEPQRWQLVTYLIESSITRK